MKRTGSLLIVTMIGLLAFAGCGSDSSTGNNSNANNTTTCEGTLADCDGDGVCETDLASDHVSCGACGRQCDPSNGSGSCIDGACVIEGCDGDYYDLDGDPANGCEYYCAPENPGEDVCDGEDNNCDGTIDEGFELVDDPDNCGACGTICDEVDGSAGVDCVGGQCVISDCMESFSDCDGVFENGCEADLSNSLETCGACDNACDFGPNTEAACVEGQCENLGCSEGFADCNLDPADGCEVDLSAGQSCECTPGETRPCYDGDPATLGVSGAPCAEGVQTCQPSGLGWSSLCVGQVLPRPETVAAGTCDNGIDDDCNGAIDDGVDQDGDGWTTCGGDCCDNTSQGCTEPEKVNPGAYDWVDPTGVATPYDDDCDGIPDNPPDSTCSSAVNITGVTGSDLARAMDLCVFTTEASGEWGVISAQLLRADGSTPSPNNLQVGVLDSFGANVFPQANATLAALSSGTARDQDNDTDDAGYVYPDGGGFEDSSSEVLAPADYLSAHGGQLQTASGCVSGSTTVNDSVQLRLRVRVPTNAQGISFNLKFYSSEYPEWVCTSYNDFFLAMLYTGATGIPADHNISFDTVGNPISVNNAFFEVCEGCTNGTSELVSTGYPVDDAGGTVWLTTTAPVVPGEVMELHFHIWDTGDHVWDSIVLLDNFTWLVDPTEVNTTDGKE